MTDTPAIGSVRSSSSLPEASPPPPQPLLPERSPTPEPSPSLSDRDPLRRTRSSSLWTGLIVFGVVLVLLSVFILQNTQSVRISYFAATGDVSLAVAMLLATAAGVLLAAIAGSLRIWQLRRRLARSSRGSSRA
jgi:uncharacterized integral membrane protein